MENSDWFELGIFLILLLILTKVLGIYLYRVLERKPKTYLGFIFSPLERLTYRLCGISFEKTHSWKEYLGALLAFSFVCLILTFVLLMIQQFLPLNPENLSNLSWDLSFNTAVSFMTNTDWQSYSGETTMSYFSQMVVLTLQCFFLFAVGMCAVAALIRGIVGNKQEGLGNFWVDLVRLSYYVFLPLALIFTVFYLIQGVPENFDTYTQCETLSLSQKMQRIVQGPIASQESIKLIGSNGGGYTGVNSCHPYENPTPISNFFQILSIILIPAAQTYYLGRMVKNQKHGWSVFVAMLVVFLGALFVCTYFELEGNPLYEKLGIENTIGNIEGKESRFTTFESTLYGVTTTSVANGAVNSMHDSYTPIGGMVLLLNMQLGEIIFGGIGSGLYSIVLFIILAIFIAGLITGRTPEYLEKKIEGHDIKLAVLALLAFFLSIIGFSAWASVSQWGVSSLGNQGPHGLSEILYAFSSATGNNGSAFGGLSANTIPYNLALGFAMLIGRFLILSLIIALGGSFLRKKKHPHSAGSFPISGPMFTFLLIGVIILLGALTFIPSLVMGPILEEFFMLKGVFF